MPHRQAMADNPSNPSLADSAPRHVAIIMDGNGRWARQRMLPRFAGHRAGMEAVRETIKYCLDCGIEVLTLFAFSSENWQRPQEEVGALMNLFMTALEKEVSKLHEKGVRLRIVGDHGAFHEELRRRIEEAERLTADNRAMTLNIAANYGGRWDIVQASRQLAEAVAAGEMSAEELDEAAISDRLCFAGLPEPDLFIRTGGEQRISNFLLWQLAYTELYFTPKLWPEFDRAQLDEALASYRSRQRRFGRTGEQVEQSRHA